MTRTHHACRERAPSAAKRYIYACGGGHAEGDATMRDLLGGKGANLAEMTIVGIPVPPGFTITTEVCAPTYGGEKLPEACRTTPRGRQQVEQATGKASATPPTRSSCRSARAPSSRCRA